MLKRLLVTNYALIDRVELEFSPQLSIITGETGAGKSILLGALSLILGQRATDKVFFDSSRKCVVEGCFEMKQHRLKSWFEKNDLDYEEDTIIRRELQPSGKTRAFVNDTPVSLQLLKQLSEKLVQLTAQHQTLRLTDSAYQLEALDLLAGNDKLIEKYQSQWSLFTELKTRVKKEEEIILKSVQERDYVNFQFQELDNLKLIDPNEQEQLETRFRQLENAELIQSTLMEVRENGSAGDDSATVKLLSIEQLLERMTELIPAVEPQLKRLKSVRLELDDLLQEVDAQLASEQANPGEQERLRVRLDELLRLQKKHNRHSVTELIKWREELNEQLFSGARGEEELLALKEQLKKEEAKLRKLATSLTAARKKATPKAEKKLSTLFKSVGMESATLQMELIENSDAALNSLGAEQVRFLFSANTGSEARELKKVASGGELSRLMLVMQSLLADRATMPCLIFDEIDTGISGDTAIKVGKVLHQLSEKHQLICITHLPQIASTGNRHFKVFKEGDGKRTVSKVQLLSEEERLVEIGTILSGKPPGNEALANAKQLRKTMGA